MLILKGHPNAASLRNMPFPYYDDFATIFGKDRAHCLDAEGPS